jgi:uncharacterized protein YdeI (YjbR/CyaY-like superfamily)
VTTLDIRGRERWRAWLARHHASANEVWLVFHKRHTGRASIEYEAAVEEALCFGWVDSLIKRLDADRYARKFTPRKPDSKWSTANRRRYLKVQAEGRLTAAGRARAPTARGGDAPRLPVARPQADLVTALDARPAARRWFDALAPSYKRQYIRWIAAAKRPETRARRLREAVALLSAGKTLGLK